jgi:AraC-like DNA-binding protein/mannose-6-phosphate isomerase-like protein (cupin superfamily)
MYIYHMNRNSNGVKFVHLGRLGPLAGWYIKKHIHEDSHELILVRQGAIETQIGNQTLVGTPGQALVYPKGEWHQEKAQPGAGPLETWFAVWTEEPAAEFTPLSPRVIFDRDERILRLFQWLNELAFERTNASGPLSDALMFAVSEEVRRLCRTDEPEFVRKVRQFVDERLARPLELADLARAVSLSPYRFAHVFKTATGEPPMVYLRRRRMETARTLLLSTPLPLKAIAEQVGCSDEFVFSKQFKKVTGVSPGSLRKRRR